MDLLPYEIVYNIVEYLLPSEYIAYATAYRRIHHVVNIHYREAYQALIKDQMYCKCCPEEDTQRICRTCRYTWCADCSDIYACWGCNKSCAKCNIVGDDLCCDCLLYGINAGNVIYCNICSCFCYTKETWHDHAVVSHKHNMAALCDFAVQYACPVSDCSATLKELCEVILA